MTEHRKCTGTCGENGSGRVLPLTEEYFFRHNMQRGDFRFIRRCKDCVAASQAEQRRRRIERKATLRFWNTVVHERPEPYDPENAEERSARIVRKLPALPWESEGASHDGP